jgi:hypothetical protein
VRNKGSGMPTGVGMPMVSFIPMGSKIEKIFSQQIPMGILIEMISSQHIPIDILTKMINF